MYDPSRLLRHARREAAIVLALWLAALLWTIGYCLINGYQHAPDSWWLRSGLAHDRTPDDFRTIAGLPDWVAIGIVLPWLLCTAATLVFGFFIMRDDELGAEREEDGHGA